MERRGAREVKIGEAPRFAQYSGSRPALPSVNSTVGPQALDVLGFAWLSASSPAVQQAAATVWRTHLNAGRWALRRADSEM